MTDFTNISNKDVVRWIRLIWKRIERDYAGGLSFGVDWPTLRATSPHLASVLTGLMAEGRERGLS